MNNETRTSMTRQFSVGAATVAIAMLGLTSHVGSASKNFVPDAVFTASTLAGWQAIGQADWRAEKGEIVGTPKSGGWLVLDRSYEDVAVSAEFRCAAGCKTGVLLRAEKTAEGGLKGIFVSLNEGDLAAYRVTLDAKGIETSREKLRAPGPGQLRVAPPPPASSRWPLRRLRRAESGAAGARPRCLKESRCRSRGP